MVRQCVLKSPHIKIHLQSEKIGEKCRNYWTNLTVIRIHLHTEVYNNYMYKFCKRCFVVSWPISLIYQQPSQAEDILFSNLLSTFCLHVKLFSIGYAINLNLKGSGIFSYTLY